MDSDKPTKLLSMAREISFGSPDFQKVQGPGAGNHATQQFMRDLRHRARDAFGADYGEKKLCGDTSLAVDFYFPDEATIVEVALGLPNPASEFEKDILKAIMAQDFGHEVRCLLFISRAGAVKKCSQPGRQALRQWANTKHQLVVEVQELGGEPRRRRRQSRVWRDA